MKKLISILLTAVIFLNTFCGAAFTAADAAMEKAGLHLKSGTPDGVLLSFKTSINETDFNPGFVVHKTGGEEYPAYCINPNKPGVKGAGEYDVDISEAINNPQVYGAIINGYPFKSPSELGVSTDYEAYYATAIAVWTLVHDVYSDVNDWAPYPDPGDTRVYNAMKNIRAKGLATSSIPTSGGGGTITATPSPSVAKDDEIDDNYFSQTFTVSTASAYSVSLGSGAPSGTKITDENNTVKSSFSAGEKFKVLIPKIGASQGGNFKLNISGGSGGDGLVVLWGKSANEDVQDYAVVSKDIATSGQATSTYIEEPGTPKKPEIYLQIVKVADGTTKLLAGAVFRVIKADGGVVGDFVTDDKGQVTVMLDDYGSYYVEEISAPAGYQLDITAHKDINITKPTENVLTFTNKPYSSLKITKVDADTGEKLNGAVIRLAYDGGNDFTDIEIGAGGSATIENLCDGTYTVKEIVAPSGYILDSTPHMVKLEAGKTAEIILENNMKPGLLIKKFDETTGLPLGGAEFSVAEIGGKIVYEGIIPQDGKIHLTDLNAGWYVITEIAAPDGYLMTAENKTVYLEKGKVLEVKFDNRLRPSLQIVKLDYETNQPLEGAVFHVKKTESSTVSEYVTNANGTITILDLDQAVYSVHEVKAPSGYLLEEQHKDIKLEWGKTKSLVFTNKARPALEILKIDEATEKPLSGAKFRVTATESKTTGEYVTGTDGRILITGLNDEIYSVEEIVAPDGYLLEPQHKDIQLEWGKTKQLVFTNKARPALEILKVDTVTRQPLAGAKFKVTKTEDLTVSEYTTDADGRILIKNLDEAVYTVEEITAPDGYILNPQKKEIQLEWGKTKNLIYENTRKPTLIVTKTNALTYEPIPNTSYKIEYEDNNGGVRTLGTYRTDKNGQIVIPKANSGWHIITETAAAPGYSLAANPINRKYLAPGENAYTNLSVTGVSGDNSGTIITALSGVEFALGAEIFDYPLNSIVIRKSHYVTGELLAGAVFEVRKVTEEVSGTSGTIIGRYTTDNSGVIVLTGLVPGGYIVEEVKAPANFLIPENSQQQVWLKPDGTSIVEATFANIPYGNILITKVDAQTNKPLANARFRVTDGTGAVAGNTNGEFITDENGEIRVTNLKPGSYVVTEIEAPANYVVDTTPLTVNIGVDGKTYKVAFKNQPYGSLLITKVDAQTNKPLANAKFRVTDGTGAVAGSTNGEFITNENGEILVSNLKPGSYVVTEIEAPEYYAIDTTPQTVAVNADGKVYKVSFKNQPAGTLVIRKLDTVSKEPLTNAQFKVSAADGEVVGTNNGIFKTDATGTIVIPALPKGSYVIEETKAPEGYILENQSQTIAIDYGKTYTLDFYNKKMSGLQIIKIDSVTKQPLKGAEFAVYKQNGEIVDRYTTDADGVIIIATLAPGWYKVVETKTIGGYVLDETPKDVQITDNQFVKVIFENAPMSTLVIRKGDADTREPLAGAEFTVKAADGLLLGVYRSDVDGVVTIPEVAPGWYTVTETKAPEGYTLGDNVQNVQIKHSKTVTLEFWNRPFGSLNIKKIDEITGDPLSGANFSVSRQSGGFVGEYTTGKDGTISIPSVEPDWYVVSETKAPSGYTLDSTAKTVEVKSGVPSVVTFTNKPLSGIEIIKIDAVSKAPLMGATFTVERSNGEKIGIYKSDAAGKIIVPDLTEGTYVVAETIAPDGYILSETPKTVIVKSGKLTTVEFINKPLSGIEIIKMDAVSKAPLMGATFTVERADGEKIGTYKSDAAGKIIVPDLTEGTYVVVETIAPDGYILSDTPKTVTVKSGKLTAVEFTNKPLSGIEIVKIDSVSKAPLIGATFVVERDNGEKVGTYKTDIAGKIIVQDLTEGTYVVSETIAPDGYMLNETPKIVVVKSGKLTPVEFSNKPHSGIEIIKVDAVTKAPLMDATFVVERDNGEKIGTYKTDVAGKIIVPDLAEGTYIVSETIAPDGYMLNETPKTIVVKSGKLTSVEFTNKPYSGIEIIKADAVTKTPLMGATFVVERDSGEKVGTYKTDIAGKIIVPDLAEGTYIISETAAPNGYILDEAPKTVIVKSGKITIVEFFNKPLAGLKIIKLDSVTRNPIAGVEFVITKMTGEKVENHFRGYTFKTDRTGQIYIPKLADGYYTVTETRAADGYILDGEPKTVLVESGKTTVLEVLNTPMSGLLIVKTDAITGKPLAGVVFDIKHADGSFVAGNILDGNQPNTANNSHNKTTSPNGDITGSYTTDANGRILINGLSAGQYNVTERKALDGYELDTSVHNVTVTPGKLATLQLTNKPLGGIRLTKIDSMSKKPIYNVEFMLFDSDNKVIGTYYTDNNGKIDFPNTILAGRYTIRETRAADGYYLDETPKTVEFTAGKVTEITWTNSPQMGQIQILKKSGDSNETNGLPKGTPLSGAIFEVYNYKTGNLVDRFISGDNGYAVSSPLPLGRYTVKEVKAPKYYKLSDKKLDVTIEFATQIVKHEFLNYSANTGVYIKKTGNMETMPGDLIKYDIKAVQNTSTVPLENFFWRDILPTTAVRLNKIVTGTYNQSLKYKIIATTNRGDEIILADNLSTTKNNVIDCSNASLGLSGNEYVTSFTLVFGTVKAGFSAVEKPKVYVNVLKSLPNNYQFANKCDVGGKYGGEWIVGNSTWVTRVYAHYGKLPNTGY